MTAHYFSTRKRKFVVLSETLAPVGKEIPVTSKTNAREVAAKHNAMPWNF